MPLRSEMRSTTELRYTVEDGEGLGWALDEYHPEVIEDPKLRALWDTARDAMEGIRSYLESSENYESNTRPLPTIWGKEKDDPSRENQSYRRKDGTWHAAVIRHKEID